MNKEVKAEWLEALTNGDYKQGKKRLKDDDKYCCLGVLCDLYAKETGDGRWEDNRFKTQPDFVGYIGDGFTLPKEVRIWADIPMSSPSFHIDTVSPYTKKMSKTLKGRKYRSHISLATLNDGGKRFSTIAKVIEAEL